ncbi:MAG: hypothetical protein OK456_08415 [Thaumarchaeota archaeon]|nr:hypothetical protein [Nitrososphaerota archaeon]
MKCSEVRTFLFQISTPAETITPVSTADLNYLTSEGYVLTMSRDDYDSGVAEVARLSDMSVEAQTMKEKEQQADAPLQQDERKEHSILFHFEHGEEKDELRQRVETETTVVSGEQAQLVAMENNVNLLIQKKSAMDRMVPYGGVYVALTDLGTVILNDLNVRNYRVADEEFADFSEEVKATYAELRGIVDDAVSALPLLRIKLGDLDENYASADDEINSGSASQGSVKAPALLWSIAIGLAKLQGDQGEIKARFADAIDALEDFGSSTPNRLMAAEIMTASSEDIQTLESNLRELDQQVRALDVPGELSAGVAATIMAGRRYDGTYPMDRFAQLKELTPSSEAAAILAVIDVPVDELTSKFEAFRSMFVSWGYTKSEDTEVASAFLAIGQLEAVDVEEKLKYIVEQLKNYLAYPLVAAGILASIPVFEAHETLDLLEKAVTLLTFYATGLERSVLVTLAVRMIHGVRNEVVQKIDSTAKIAATPVQFTYPAGPSFFPVYFPVILAHSSYLPTFSAMGGFHPAHSHGIGGFAG